jgi:hypothetical protein
LIVDRLAQITIDIFREVQAAFESLLSLLNKIDAGNLPMNDVIDFSDANDLNEINPGSIVDIGRVNKLLRC